MTGQMHLGVVFLNGPTQQSIGEWRIPANRVASDYTSPAFWQNVGRILERGKFDLVFFADILGTFDSYGGSIDAAVRYSTQFPVHDPIPLLPIITGVTDRIGVAATHSTTYSHPYLLARTFASLVHLTNGRAGWNAVASSFMNEAADFGLDTVMGHDERYERADEFIEVCKKLWASWDRDAVIMDREAGVWGDPSKVRRIDHVGKYFKSGGPLNVAPSRHGPPVILAAGQSPRGLDFCARHAEGVFAIEFTTAAMKKHRDSLRERARAAGRNPDDVKMLWGVLPIVGETEAAARAKEQMLRDAVDPVGGMALLSSHLGIDLSRIPLDARLEDIGSDTGSRGLAEALARNAGKDVTVEEAVKVYAAGNAPHVVGTAEQVADQLEQIHHESGGDGFLLRTHYLPACLDEFVDGVVPLLQERGLFRKDYAGATLREHLQE